MHLSIAALLLFSALARSLPQNLGLNDISDISDISHPTNNLDDSLSDPPIPNLHAESIFATEDACPAANPNSRKLRSRENSKSSACGVIKPQDAPKVDAAPKKIPPGGESASQCPDKDYPVLSCCKEWLWTGISLRFKYCYITCRCLWFRTLKILYLSSCSFCQSNCLVRRLGIRTAVEHTPGITLLLWVRTASLLFAVPSCCGENCLYFYSKTMNICVSTCEILRIVGIYAWQMTCIHFEFSFHFHPTAL